MKRIWRDALSAVTPYEAGKSLEALEAELGLPSLRRLSANENPLGPPPKVVEALRRESARAHLYPDAGSTELRKAIATRLAGATVVASPLGGYETDLDDLRARVTPRTKVIFLCTPHNPATTIVPRGPLDSFLASLGDEPPLVVIDEAYRDFCDDPDTPDGVALARRRPRVVSLRTFSKVAGLAGLRVGFLVAQPEAIGWVN